MLIDELQMFDPNPIGDLIARVNKGPTGTRKIQKGVYQIGHFSPHLSGYNEYPDNLENDIYEYGVCDDVKQLLSQCPMIENDSNRQFIIVLTEIVAADQPEDGGWRWHKWGPYIGTHKITAEYIYDELEISSVYVYHIYEKIS